MSLREFTVAGALVESAVGLLLVCNRRPGGFVEWTTPGGVIDDTDATLRDGLTREVAEETGLVVTEWEGPVYEVNAVAPGLGWSMRCEVHRAVRYEGDLVVDDPDGIVIDARFAEVSACAVHLATCSAWVREPIVEWLATRWGSDRARLYAYEVNGADRHALQAVRV